MSRGLGDVYKRQVLGAALYQRFASRGEDDFANKLLSALRFEFGGHHEKK